MQQAVITCVMTSSGPGLLRAMRSIPDFEFGCPDICAFLRFLHVWGSEPFYRVTHISWRNVRSMDNWKATPRISRNQAISNIISTRYGRVTLLTKTGTRTPEQRVKKHFLLPVQREFLEHGWSKTANYNPFIYSVGQSSCRTIILTRGCQFVTCIVRKQLLSKPGRLKHFVRKIK